MQATCRASGDPGGTNNKPTPPPVEVSTGYPPGTRIDWFGTRSSVSHADPEPGPETVPAGVGFVASSDGLSGKTHWTARLKRKLDG